MPRPTPIRVAALILRGIFLCRQSDMNWLYVSGANQIFPDYWEEFIKAIP
jgi:proline iminopeptidase